MDKRKVYRRSLGMEEKFSNSATEDDRPGKPGYRNSSSQNNAKTALTITRCQEQSMEPPPPIQDIKKQKKDGKSSLMEEFPPETSSAQERACRNGPAASSNSNTTEARPSSSDDKTGYRCRGTPRNAKAVVTRRQEQTLEPPPTVQDMEITKKQKKGGRLEEFPPDALTAQELEQDGREFLPQSTASQGDWTRPPALDAVSPEATTPGAVAVSGPSSNADGRTVVTNSNAIQSSPPLSEGSNDEVLFEAELVEENGELERDYSMVYLAQAITQNKRRTIIWVIVGLILVAAVAVGVTLAVTNRPSPTTLSPTAAPTLLPPTATQPPSPQPSVTPSAQPTNPITLAPTTSSPSSSPTESAAPSLSPTFNSVFAVAATLPAPSDVADFGTFTAVSSNGTTVAVSTTNEVYVYRRQTDGDDDWIIMGNSIVIEDDQVDSVGSHRRRPLDLAQDGQMVSIVLSKSVHVFLYDGSSWIRRGQSFSYLTAADDCCGAVSSQLTEDGAYLVVATTSTEDDGSGNGIRGYTVLYQYSSTSGLWEQVGERIIGFNSYTYSKVIGVSDDADIIAVGNPSEIGTGEVRVYTRRACGGLDNATWCQMGQPLVGGDYEDLFGDTISLSADGSRVAIGAPGIIQCGGVDCFTVRVFAYSDGTRRWLQLGQALRLNNGVFANGFGHVVDFSADGNTLAVLQRTIFETDYSVTVYQFDPDSQVWTIDTGKAVIEGVLWSDMSHLTMAMSRVEPFVLALAGTSNGTSISIYHS